MTQRPILVVEDDPAIRRGLVDALRFAGHEVVECGDGEAGLATALEVDVALVLLDVMLPKRDGLSVLRELRTARPTLPIIMVTARGAEADRVQGLEDGADDYVCKPFSATELLARINAVMRRTPERPDDVTRLTAGDRTIDLARREVTFADGTSRHLSDRESGILRYLAASAGRAVTREELLQRVWGLNPRGITTRTVDMHVARLREKLQPNGTGVPAPAAANGHDTDRVVETVRGKGYMLASTVEVQR